MMTLWVMFWGVTKFFFPKITQRIYVNRNSDYKYIFHFIGFSIEIFPPMVFR